jgi:hypothetical protein
LLVALGASTLTHPALWFLVAPHWPARFGNPDGFPSPYLTMTVCAESAIVFIEGIFVYAATLPRGGLLAALLLSLSANGLSLSLGLLSRRLIGWP